MMNNYSKIFNKVRRKNISVELLKQIIEARINEIVELVLLKSDYVKKLNRYKNQI